MQDDKPHGNAGNKHAAKPDHERADTVVHIRVNKATKAKWIKAAKPGKLSAWVLATLNASIGSNE